MFKNVMSVLLLIGLTGCGARLSEPGDPSFAVTQEAAAPDQESQQVQWPALADRGDAAKASTEDLPLVLDGSGAKAIFSQLDVNRDGKLSQKEYLARSWRWNPYPKQTFKAADSNRDGALSLDEFVSEYRSHTGAAVAAVGANDRDMDWELGYTELLHSPLFGQPKHGWEPGEKDVVVQNFIERYSPDGNGRISIEELMLAFKQGIPQARE